MDSLNGSLEAFALADVLRFLAVGKLSGVLRVETAGMTGRIFLVDGEVTYATTRADEGSVAALMKRQSLPERERRGRNAQGRFPDPLGELIHQQIIEVLVRLERGRDGRFWFVQGVTTKAYGDSEPRHHDVPSLLEAADRRSDEWKTLDPIVRSGTPFRLRPRLAEDTREVIVGQRAWEFLAAIGDQASVQEVAERLGTFEFAAAKMVGELVRSGLLLAAEDASDVRRSPREMIVQVESEAG